MACQVRRTGGHNKAKSLKHKLAGMLFYSFHSCTLIFCPDPKFPRFTYVGIPVVRIKSLGRSNVVFQCYVMSIGIRHGAFAGLSS